MPLDLISYVRREESPYVVLTALENVRYVMDVFSHDQLFHRELEVRWPNCSARQPAEMGLVGWLAGWLLEISLQLHAGGSYE